MVLFQNMDIDTETFLRALRQIASPQTSADPARWSNENVLWGHCAVAALLAQDYFGGALVRGSLQNTKYEHLRSHYWNRMRNGEEIDFTSSQYTDISIEDLRGEERLRDRVLSYPDTVRRYKILKEKFEQNQEISPGYTSL